MRVLDQRPKTPHFPYFPGPPRPAEPSPHPVDPVDPLSPLRTPWMPQASPHPWGSVTGQWHPHTVPVAARSRRAILLPSSQPRVSVHLRASLCNPEQPPATSRNFLQIPATLACRGCSNSLQRYATPRNSRQRPASPPCNSLHLRATGDDPCGRCM